MSNHYRLPLATERPPVNFPGAPDQPYDYQESRLGGPPPAGRFLKCICWIACLLLLAFVITVIVLAIKWQIKEPLMNADYLKISSLQLTQRSIAGKFSVGFTVWNKNGVMKFQYKDVVAEVLYKTDFLGAGGLDDFRQGVKNMSKVSTEIDVDSPPLTHKKVHDLIVDIIDPAILYFNVMLKAHLVEIIPGFDDKTRYLQAKCDGLKVVLDPGHSSGSTSKDDGWRTCSIIL